MSTETEKSIDEILKERDERKARIEAEKEARHRRDLIKLNELELEHGDENVAPVWTKAGLVVLKRPTKSQVDEYQPNWIDGN